MRVGLFITCLTDTYFPRVGAAVVRVLRHYGCQVECPAGQTCCGQPAYNSGFHTEAAALARRMIPLFEPFEYVVTPSASCAAMVQHHFAELMGADSAWRARAESLAARTYEFSVFLRERLHVDLAAHLRFEGPFTYHYPCHARDSYSAATLADELGRSAGARLVAPARTDLCCGFGGMFAIDFPEISAAMLDEKLAVLTATGARTIVCNEGGCTLHMAGGAHRRGLPLRFTHVAEQLAESLGLLEPPP
jgi:L-lactate dehydrogenase complex protein LldE